MSRQKSTIMGRSVWGAIGTLVLVLAGGYLLGRAACRAEQPGLAVRGAYDVSIARECVDRGDVIVVVLDLEVLEGASVGRHEFACARVAQLQSLTVRAQ